MTAAAKELAKLGENLDIEEVLSRQSVIENAEDDEEDDNVEGWMDERELMTEEEREGWDETSASVRLMLVKASHLLFVTVLANVCVTRSFVNSRTQ